MPQDVPDAISPLEPFSGSYPVPELGMVRRWFDASDVTDELRDEILEVIRIAFNDDADWFHLPVPRADHFEWKFRDRPTGVTLGLSEDEQGHIFGFVGSVRRIWYVHGRPYVNRAGYDVARLPEWQGRGLGRGLQPYRGRDWHPSEDFSLGYATHPTERHLSKERGINAPANETHDYVRYLGAPTRARRALGRLGSGLVARVRQRGATRDGAENEAEQTVSYTSRVIRESERGRRDQLRDLAERAGLLARSLTARRRAPAIEGLSIETIARFEDSHEPMIEAAMRPFEFVGDRSIGYLNWRHCDERGGPYTVRLARVDGVAVGYAVTRVYDGNAYLADILVVRGQRPVAEALIRDAVQLAQQGQALFIATTLPHYHPYVPALGRAGFIDVGHVAGELFDMRNAPYADLAFLERADARIHHVMADSDIV